MIILQLKSRQNGGGRPHSVFVNRQKFPQLRGYNIVDTRSSSDGRSAKETASTPGVASRRSDKRHHVSRSDANSALRHLARQPTAAAASADQAYCLSPYSNDNITVCWILAYFIS